MALLHRSSSFDEPSGKSAHHIIVDRIDEEHIHNNLAAFYILPYFFSLTSFLSFSRCLQPRSLVVLLPSPRLCLCLPRWPRPPSSSPLIYYCMQLNNYIGTAEKHPNTCKDVLNMHHASCIMQQWTLLVLYYLAQCMHASERQWGPDSPSAATSCMQRWVTLLLTRSLQITKGLHL